MVSEWRPIETAPQWAHVLLWFPRGQHVIALMGNSPTHWEAVGYMGDDDPTHWMPLPDPPPTPAAGGGAMKTETKDG